MGEQEKVTRAKIDSMWNRFQDEVIAHPHDSARREQLIKERLPELSSMIEHCDDITGDQQDLVSQLGDHIRQLGLEAMPTKLSVLYFEEKQRSSRLPLDRKQAETGLSEKRSLCVLLETAQLTSENLKIRTMCRRLTRACELTLHRCQTKPSGAPARLLIWEQVRSRTE